MSVLPTGTVTFLFTDIEGSTRRWQEDPSMSTALARHDGILRKAVEVNRGHLLKHTGDGAVAVFQAAGEALAAAVDAQRALAEEDWDGEPLEARMAVHTGEAEERDGDYFGPALNVASRLMAAGHGGQILVSLTTEELIRKRVPHGGRLVDLGEHRLRDLDHPEKVFQVVADGLQDVFPPLATVAHAATNLPEPRTSFVGREADVADVVRLLGSHRLVTLVGVGGAGKTRLAIEVAHRSLDRFPGGVYFGDLSVLTDGAAVARAVAEALGMPPTGGPSGTAASRSIEDEVAAFLRDRRALLVLDNCEHLLDDCADLVDGLLVTAPHLAVLATSREALAVEGEQSWQVRSLSLPEGDLADDSEAMHLLVERIRSVRPDFELRPDNGEALAEICIRLDGIPLALELAAARAAHLAPGDIAQRLGDRFKLLAGGRRRAQRQQTLQAAVDWSYDLLTPEEQALLRRLAVFAGGFTLDAVEGVGGAGIDAVTVDLLGSLVDKSLVLSDAVAGQTRYRLLETIRLYAEGKLLEAGEAESVRSRHRDWFLELVERHSLDQCVMSEEVIHRLNPDYDNLRAALEWCEAQERPDLQRRLFVRMSQLIARYGRFAEAERWFEQVLAHEKTLPREEWLTHLLVEWVNTFQWTGNPAEGEASLRRLEALIEDLPERGPVRALGRMAQAGQLTVFPKRAAEVERYADLAAEVAGDENPLMRQWSLWVKSVAYLYQHRVQDASELLEGLRRPAQRMAEFGAPYLDSTLGLVRHLEGRHEEALELIGEELWTFNSWLLFERMTMAATTAALGRTGEARSLMRDAVTSVRTVGWQHPLAGSDCLVGFAALAAIEGDAERASRLAAAVPFMATSTPTLWVLLRHYRDLVRDQLEPATRRRCVEEGRATVIDEAIDTELARWDSEVTPERAPSP